MEARPVSTPPDLRLSFEAAAEAEVDVLVIGTRPEVSEADAEETVTPGSPVLVGAGGTAEEVVKLPTRGAVAAPLVLAVGLGPDPDTRAADGTAGAPDLAE